MKSLLAFAFATLGSAFLAGDTLEGEKTPERKKTALLVKTLMGIVMFKKAKRSFPAGFKLFFVTKEKGVPGRPFLLIPFSPEAPARQWSWPEPRF